VSMPQKTISPLETGLALSLALLLGAYFSSRGWLLPLGITTLVLSMGVPALFTPLSRVLTRVVAFLGGVLSPLLLSLVFFLVVTPVGLCMRLFIDPMKRRRWREKKSAFEERNVIFSAEDIRHPY